MVWVFVRKQVLWTVFYRNYSLHVHVWANYIISDFTLCQTQVVGNLWAVICNNIVKLSRWIGERKFWYLAELYPTKNLKQHRDYVGFYQCFFLLRATLNSNLCFSIFCLDLNIMFLSLSVSLSWVFYSCGCTCTLPLEQSKNAYDTWQWKGNRSLGFYFLCTWVNVAFFSHWLKTNLHIRGTRRNLCLFCSSLHTEWVNTCCQCRVNICFSLVTVGYWATCTPCYLPPFTELGLLLC